MSDFDRYVAEHNIPEEDWPEAFARWIAEHTGGPAPRFEKVEPGDEQILSARIALRTSPRERSRVSGSSRSRHANLTASPPNNRAALAVATDQISSNRLARARRRPTPIRAERR